MVARLEAGVWFHDTYYDNEHQVAIFYGTEEAYRLTASDADCIGDSEVLRGQVEHVVATFRESRASECHAMSEGSAPEPGADPRGVEVDPDAWEAYREEVCAGSGPSQLLGEGE